MGGVESRGNPFGRVEWMSLAIASVWGTGLLVAAAVVPVYRSVGVSSSGTVSHGSATLAGVNGWGVLLVLGVPLAATVMVGGALWRRGGRQGAGALAWTIAALPAGFNVLALASVGVFIIPVTACLAVACSTHGRMSDRRVSHSGLAG